MLRSAVLTPLIFTKETPVSDLNRPIYQDFDYIQGQIAALHALVLGLAQSIPREVFQKNALHRIETLRTTYLNSPREGADVRLQALDACEQWLRNMSSEKPL